MFRKNGKGGSSFFVPTDMDSSHLIGKIESVAIVNKILGDESVPEGKRVEFESNYNNLVQKDLYKRIVVDGAGWDGPALNL
jgi:hypothetical protein